jgi:RNA polymerase sigma factor (sigma-70 family)
MNANRTRFEAQVLPHLDAAFRLALALSRSRSDAEDVVQEALLRAFRGIERLRGTDAKAWLLTIVRNCFFTARERLQKQAPLSLNEARIEDMALPQEFEPENASVLQDRRLALGAVLNELSEEHREILVLREVEDMSYREIAVIDNLPIGTVMSRLARARLAFRELWLAHHGAVQS